MARSIVELKGAKQCFICQSTINVEKHHIFYGTSNRKNADKYGLTVHLCRFHHRDKKQGVHFDRDLDRELKKLAQKMFERKHGHERFMEVFGKNYLEEDEWVIR